MKDATVLKIVKKTAFGCLTLRQEYFRVYLRNLLLIYKCETFVDKCVVSCDIMLYHCNLE